VTGILDAAVIDVHAHVVLQETMGAAGQYGPTLGAHPDGTPWFQVGSYRLDGVRYVGSPFMDPEIRLAQMSAAGIDFQILSPNPLTYMHFIEPAEAIRFCRAHNDALAGIVARYPERLGGLAALPIQDPVAARDELERSVRDLGLWGAAIGTDSPRPLHHPDLDQLYEGFVELDVPLFIHPGPAGIDGPGGDPMLKLFDLDVVIGFAAQEALAVAALIYGGVLDRHPDLDVCLSHGGGSTGYLIGRMARAARKRPWSPQHLRAEGAFESRFARLWLDTHLNSEASLGLLVSVVGTERLVFGTNFAGWDAPDRNDAHQPEPWLASNARRLLRAERHAARPAT
jgi:aminocarboxymuconate-semialdehyde decarboxylase